MNDYERCRLEEIESALRASDPGLDRALRTLRPRRHKAMWWLSLGWLSAVGLAFAGWWMILLVALGPLLATTYIALKPGVSTAGLGTYTGDGPQSWPHGWNG